MYSLLVTSLALSACSEDRAQSRSKDGASSEVRAIPPLSLQGNIVDAQLRAPACNPCDDFPAAPIVDTTDGAPLSPALTARFDTNATSQRTGACVVEPPLSADGNPGALFPHNWLRPRVRFVPQPGEDLWELRFKTPRQRHPLIVFTDTPSWTMPRDIWRGLGDHNRDTEIELTIRGLQRDDSNGEVSITTGTFGIAPVAAEGKLVYWATTTSEVAPTSSSLMGFSVGDEIVANALTVTDIGNRAIPPAGGRGLRSGSGVGDGHVQCIGCHVSTPDGQAVAFTDHWPWNNVLSLIIEGRAGERPDYLTASAERLLSQPWLGMQTMSKAHWNARRRILVTTFTPRGESAMDIGYSDNVMYPSDRDGLMWINLATEASIAASPEQGDEQQQLNAGIAAARGDAFDILALEGEMRSVAAPDFSHDGTRLVYTSADYTRDGRIADNNRDVDLHMVPFNQGQGGEVSDVPFAAEPDVAEYYPAFSPDDRLIAYNRVSPMDGGAIYYRPDAEIFVTSLGGETPATRLLANDPPACSGERSPGVINSWAKWAPQATRAIDTLEEFGMPERTFYFLIFSSARTYPGQFDLPQTGYSPPDTRSSQLYMTAIVRDESSGKLSTYPAVYLWNQSAETSNLTPAWDRFELPDYSDLEPLE